MRIAALTLQNYGAFVGRSVSFAPGLTVVYGPNESGKSTLRTALGDALWNMPARSHPYAFNQSTASLALVFEVLEQFTDSERQATLTVNSRGYKNGDGTVVVPWWREGPVANREQWLNALSLDLSSLRAGGQAVLDDGGDLRELLFQARAGVDIGRAIKRLELQADALYKKHAGNKSVSVRVTLRDFETARAATEAATSSAAEVQKLEVESVLAHSQAKEVQDRYVAADSAHKYAEASVRAWSSATQLHAVSERISELVQSGRILSLSELQAYESARDALVGLAGQAASLDQSVKAIDAKLAVLVVDEPLLGFVDVTQDLVAGRVAQEDRIARMADARNQLETLRLRLIDVASGISASRSWSSHMSWEDLRSQIQELLIPVDVSDVLDRQAHLVVDAEGAVDAAKNELDSARRKLAEFGQATEGDDAGQVAGTRALRDAKWQEIKEPWLSGDLPDPDVRHNLALNFGLKVVESDAAADEHQRNAESLGRLHELDGEVSRREVVLATARSNADGLREKWSALLREASVPEMLDAAGWEVRQDILTELRTGLTQASAHEHEISTHGRESAAYLERLSSTAADVGVEGELPWGALDSLQRRVNTALQSDGSRKELQDQHEEVLRKLENLAESRAGYQAILQTVIQEDDIEKVVERSSELLRLREEERALLAEIKLAIGPEFSVEDVVNDLRGVGEADVAERALLATEEHNRLSDERDAARDHANESNRLWDDARQLGVAASLKADETTVAERLAATAEEYLQVRLMLSVLKAVLAEDQPAGDTALLEHAASLLQRLTLGRISDLQAEDFDGGVRLRVVAQGLNEGTTSELSEGTADQVFLALRLAGIRQTQARSNGASRDSLPVVLDDVLSAHDDERTEAALQVLLDEARDQQIILTTHHRAVADQARSLGIFVETLEPFVPLQVVEAHGSGPRNVTDTDDDPGRVREWARANGYSIGDRGRIPSEIADAYVNRHEFD